MVVLFMSEEKKAAKKLTARSKVVAAVVGFLITFYLLVVGFGYLKSWYEFRPYSKLASQQSERLGGGFSRSDKSSCGLDEPDCPSVHMVKDQTFTVDSAKNLIDTQKSFFNSAKFSELKLGSCDLQDELGYCFISAIDDKSGLIVRLSVKLNLLRIDITSP